jgi:hypothetical protein
MFGDYSRELLRNGIIEARAGNRDLARRYLDRALYAAGNHEVLAEGWYWMSQVTDDPAEARQALENCLSHSLHHAPARRALAILDGRLKPDEIVDPDRLPPPPVGLRQADAERFMCPKCGGRMAFAPDGQALVCEYCTRGQRLGLQTGPAGEQDFILAMATARGHSRALAEQVFHCQGCGSEFLLPPRLISAACVYCDSPHVVNLERARDLLAPDGILPHAFNQTRAVRLLIEWVERNRFKPEQQVDPPRGLYLPLWTFDVGGAIDYTGETVVVEQDFSGREQPAVTRVSDQFPILLDDLPVPASRKPAAPFVRLLPTFDLSAVKPYDPRFLADWPAEVYDIPLADASLDARSQAYARSRRDLPSLLSPLRIVHTSSANLTIESFRLLLLPVWMTEIPLRGRARLVLINGQSGAVEGDLSDVLDDTRASTAKSGLPDWLSDILDGD